MNLRELNYILIPKAAVTATAWESTRTGRLLRPLFELLASVTPEGAAIFVTMLVAGAAGIDVRYSNLYLVFSALFSLLVVAVLLRPLGAIRADELHVGLEHPAHVSAGAPLCFTLVLNNTGRRALHALRIEGPFLPWDGTYEGRPPLIEILRPGEVVRVPVTTRFLLRGERSLGRFSVGSVRPLGLLRGNRRRSEAPRFTVLPRRVEVQGLPVPPARAGVAGSPVSALAGDSFELLGVRPYRPGDRPRDLHARAWARHGVPIVRELRMESHREVGLLVDLTGAPGRDLADAALALTAGLLEALLALRVRVDLAIVAAGVTRLTVGERAAPLEAALEALALAEVAPSAGPAEAPWEVPHGRWSACHAVTTHVPGRGAEEPFYARVEALRVLDVPVTTYAVREKPRRGEAPPADRIIDAAALSADAPVSV